MIIVIYFRKGKRLWSAPRTVNSKLEGLQDQDWKNRGFRKPLTEVLAATSPVAKFIVPDWGDKTNSGIDLLYRPARLHRLASRYDNTVPESTIYPPFRDYEFGYCSTILHTGGPRTRLIWGSRQRWRKVPSPIFVVIFGETSHWKCSLVRRTSPMLILLYVR